MNRSTLEKLLSLSTLSLATTGPGGEAHVAPVYFAAAGGSFPGGSELRLYFFSDGSSQHAQDIERNPQAAGCIYPACEGWHDILGLQVKGEARQVPPGPEWELAWAVYLARFPFVAELKEAVARSALYAFRPRWMRLLDNRLGFGYKEEWEQA